VRGTTPDCGLDIRYGTKKLLKLAGVEFKRGKNVQLSAAKAAIAEGRKALEGGHDTIRGKGYEKPITGSTGAFDILVPYTKFL